MNKKIRRGWKKIRRGRNNPGGLLSALKPTRNRGIRIKPKRARVIGIFSCKGGVGKTTTAANVGLCLADYLGNDVLAVDANLGAPNLGLHLGELNPSVTIHDALAGEVPIEKAITKYHGLQTILGSIAYGDEIHLIDLGNYLRPLRKNYKVILIDSAPGIGAEVVAAMKACDEMFIVTNPEVPTIASTLKTFRLAERFKIPIIGVVVNRVRGEPFELPIKDVKRALGWPIIAVVPEDARVRESTAAGVPIARYKPKSRAAVEFRKLSEYLIEHIARS